MTERDNLYPEVLSIVLSMWEEEPEEIVNEVISRFSIGSDYAWELVQEAIEEERAMDEEWDEDPLFDWEGDALSSAGFGTDEDYY